MAADLAADEEIPAKLKAKVQLSDILDYAAGGTRLIVEGERVYQANHLLLVGVQTTHEDGTSIFATCLKSSAPKFEPHKILIRTKPNFESWVLECSCKAGLGKCKHVMAVLNHLLISPSIPLLSVTDVQQKWGKVAGKVVEDMYKATRLADFCYKNTDAKDTVSLTENEREMVLQSFIETFPMSSLAYELNGRPHIRDVFENTDRNNNLLYEVLCSPIQFEGSKNLSPSESLISVDDLESSELKSFLSRKFNQINFLNIDADNMDFVGPLELGLHLYYELHVNVSEYEALKICLETIDQRSSTVWKRERCCRITASNAYDLYTYYSSRPEKVKDWRKKVLNITVPKIISNQATEHGLRCEPLAIIAYERDCNKKVTKFGLLVPPHLPWLGCSPDGLVLAEEKVIEVKCPLSGKSLTIDSMISELQYLSKTDRLLKKNHRYYAQVQLNMFILKCKTADFIVYSEAEDLCFVQTINFDHNFVEDIAAVLREIYVNAFLKYVYSTHSVG